MEGATLAQTSHQLVAAFLTRSRLTTQPGSTTTFSLVIDNRRESLLRLQLAVDGVPEAWVRLSRNRLVVAPGGRDEVTVILSPPRDASATAGEHTMVIVLDPGEEAPEQRVAALVTVLPFDGFHLELLGTEGQYWVVVENAGNSPLPCSLRAEDPAGKVHCQVDRPGVELAAGERLSLPVRAVPGHRGWFGTPAMHPFAVIATPGRGEPVHATGEVFVRPLIRDWRLPAAAIVALVLTVAGLASYVTGFGSDIGWLSSSSQRSEQVAVLGAPAPATAFAASPTPAGLAKGRTAVVSNSPAGNCLSVRQYHTRDTGNPRSAKVGELCDGDQVRIVSDSVQDDGYVWWTIDNGNGVVGWAAEKAADGGDVYLQPSP